MTFASQSAHSPKRSYTNQPSIPTLRIQTRSIHDSYLQLLLFRSEGSELSMGVKLRRSRAFALVFGLLEVLSDLRSIGSERAPTVT